jgi:hypothetical protein
VQNLRLLHLRLHLHLHSVALATAVTKPGPSKAARMGCAYGRESSRSDEQRKAESVPLKHRAGGQQRAEKNSTQRNMDMPSHLQDRVSIVSSPLPACLPIKQQQTGPRRRPASTGAAPVGRLGVGGWGCRAPIRWLSPAAYDCCKTRLWMLVGPGVRHDLMMTGARRECVCLILLDLI